VAPGRQRIVFVGAEQETSAGRERLAAFRARARPGDSEILLPHFSTSGGRDAATELLRAGNLPDAALCSADVLAVGLLSTLLKEGVRVPDDIAITGFDGTDLLELIDPPISALHHPRRGDRVAGAGHAARHREPEHGPAAGGHGAARHHLSTVQRR